MKVKKNFPKQNRVPLIERAYQLARTGAFMTCRAVADRLKREGYGVTAVAIHLQGRAIRDDLTRICREAAAGLSS